MSRDCYDNAAPTQILHVCNELVHDKRTFKFLQGLQAHAWVGCLWLGLVASNIGIAAVFTKLCQGSTFERSVCGIIFTNIGMLVVVRAALQKQIHLAIHLNYVCLSLAATYLRPAPIRSMLAITSNISSVSCSINLIRVGQGGVFRLILIKHGQNTLHDKADTVTGHADRHHHLPHCTELTKEVQQSVTMITPQMS